MRSARKKPEERSISSRSRSRARFMVFFFALFLLLGLGMAVPFLFLPLARIISARHWVQTPCVIESSRVDRHHDSDNGSTYSIEIRYRYEYGGQELHSDRYSFFGGHTSGHRGKAAVVARYPPESEAVCWVDPGHPDRAVLNRDFTPEMLFGLIPMVFAAIGGIGLIFTRRRAAAGRSRAPADPSVGSATAAMPPGIGGTAPLKAQSTPMGRLIGSLFIALFWNGIVSVFIYQAVEGWRKGDGSWFLTLFLVPFVLIGLGLIALIVYSALALFNPRSRLTMESARLPLGGRIRLNWTIGGNVRRIRALKLTLEGTEQATYRRGTTTHTERSVFHHQVLLETRMWQEMGRGSIDLTVPRQTMHTFNAPNNKIQWVVRLHGDIHRWPDMDDLYILTVDPLASEGS